MSNNHILSKFTHSLSFPYTFHIDMMTNNARYNARHCNSNISEVTINLQENYKPNSKAKCLNKIDKWQGLKKCNKRVILQERLGQRRII